MNLSQVKIKEENNPSKAAVKKLITLISKLLVSLRMFKQMPRASCSNSLICVALLKVFLKSIIILDLIVNLTLQEVENKSC